MTTDLNRRTALIGTLTAGDYVNAYMTVLNWTNADRAFTDAMHRTSM